MEELNGTSTNGKARICLGHIDEIVEIVVGGESH